MNASLQSLLEAALPLLPLAALLAALVAGRYPGHAAVVRLAERLDRRRARPRARRRDPLPPTSRAGGLAFASPVISLGIARRPPPLLLGSH
jgi:hypothetical protein